MSALTTFSALRSRRVSPRFFALPLLLALPAPCWSCDLGTSVTGPTSGPAGSVIAVAVGDFHLCALGSDREAYCWGWNAYGQSGAGDTVEVHSSPTAVVGEVAFGSISAGYRHACGVTTDGELLCWGPTYGEEPLSLAGQPAGTTSEN